MPAVSQLKNLPLLISVYFLCNSLTKIVLGQNVGIAGVNIRYDLGDDQGLIVRLMCNQTATAKDTNVNFFIDGQLDNSVSDITFSGFSYYGKIEPFFSKI